MKKKKLVASIVSFVLVVMVACVGVLAASSATANIVANISYTAKGNVKATVDLSQGKTDNVDASGLNQYITPEISNTYPEAPAQTGSSETQNPAVSDGEISEQTNEDIINSPNVINSETSTEKQEIQNSDIGAAESAPVITGATTRSVHAMVQLYNTENGIYENAHEDYSNSMTINGEEFDATSTNGYDYSTTASSLKLVATPHPYYNFMGFYNGEKITSSLLSSSSSYTYNISSMSNVTVVVRFEPKKFPLKITHVSGVASHTVSSTLYGSEGSKNSTTTYSNFYYRQSIRISFTYSANYSWKSFYVDGSNYGYVQDSASANFLDFRMGYSTINIEPQLNYTGGTTGSTVNINLITIYDIATGAPQEASRTRKAGVGTFVNITPTYDDGQNEYAAQVPKDLPTALLATVKPGYKFKYWIDENRNILSYSTTYSHIFTRFGETVTATFTLPTYNLAIARGDGVTSVNMTANTLTLSAFQDKSWDVVTGANVKLEVGMMQTNYVFVGWKSTTGTFLSYSSPYTFTLNNNVAVTAIAKYLTFTYTVKTSYTDNGSSYVTDADTAGQVSMEAAAGYGGTASAMLENNGSCTIYAKETSSAYDFLGFNAAKDGTGANYAPTSAGDYYSYSFSNITADKTIYAIFAKKYSITIEIDDGVGNIVGTLTGAYHVGQKLSSGASSIFDITLNEGFIFEGWQVVSGSMPNGFDINSLIQSSNLSMPAQDLTIKAVTAETNRIVFNGTELTASGSFDLGTISLSAPQGYAGDVSYWYSLKVTNNYLSTDLGSRNYLKVYFTLPSDALGANASLTVKYLNAAGVENSAAWGSIVDGKQTFVLAPTGAASGDSIATIVVTFTTNAQNTSAANLASSLLLEAVDENGLSAEAEAIINSEQNITVENTENTSHMPSIAENSVAADQNSLVKDLAEADQNLENMAQLQNALKGEANEIVNNANLTRNEHPQN